MDSMTIHGFSALGPHYGERPPSCHPILAPGYEIPPSLVAMVQSQFFLGARMKILTLTYVNLSRTGLSFQYQACTMKP